MIHATHEKNSGDYYLVCCILLSGKYNKFMSKNISHIAQMLGRLGGKARAKSLPAEKRKKIAQMGAKARVASIKLAKRIEANFRYIDAICEMRGGARKIKQLKTCKNKLPGIYPARTGLS